MMRGLLGAVIGGLVGAAIWAAIAHLSGYEIGFIAWVVGVLAGFGMAWGRGGHGTRAAGISAAAVAFTAILAGKFLAAHLVAGQWIDEHQFDPKEAMNSAVMTEFVDQETEFTEPDDESWPPEVTAEADRRWAAMSNTERDRFIADARAEHDQAAAEGRGVLTVIAFIFSFGLFDLLWISLALSSAYKMASTSRRVDAGLAQGDAAVDAGPHRGTPAPDARTPISPGPQLAAAPSAAARHVPRSIKVAGYSADPPPAPESRDAA